MKKLTLISIISTLSFFTFSQNLTVKFEFGKSQLDENSKTQITEFIQAFKPPMVVLKGFSDTLGTVGYNKLLAQKRLAVVEGVLLDFDKTIEIEKINYGEEKSPLNDIGYKKVDVFLPQINHRAKEPNYKKPQSFLIDNTKDTTITCKNGSIIEIPKNCFDINENKDKPKGPTEIQVTEYYDAPEMIDANLSTQSGDKILETGGMLYIQAFSGNYECTMGDKAEIGIRFRGISEKDSMQMFTGIETDNGVDWQLLNPNNVDDNSERVYFIVEEMPTFPGGSMGALKLFVHSQLKYPVIAQEKGIQGRVYVSFIIDESGMIKNPKIARGVHPSLDYEALRVLHLSPRWTPGRQNGKPVSVSYTVPFNFVLDGGLPIDTTNRITTASDFDTFVQNDSAFQKYNKPFGVLNEFFLRTNKLGWLNCDKYFLYQSNKDIKVQAKTIYDNYFAIFNQNRSIMRPNSFNSKTKTIGFSNIPINAMVIGFKIINDETYFTSFKAEPNKDIYIPVFEKINKRELIDKMKQLGL
ncbi:MULTISPECIES: TonB family protein [unclassified Saccharicrinis]|uniref:TonB family protein n=1 Tax=unclassified Saccharicrinis TaxID=2646859 RepID=UPI003D3594BA